MQDPLDAEYASMPRSALEYVDADYKVRASEISGLLIRLANASVEGKNAAGNQIEKGLEERIAKEVQIAAGTNVSQKTTLELSELSSLPVRNVTAP